MEAGCFAALGIFTGLAAMAWPSSAVAWLQEAGPFVYVRGSSAVSTIDSQSNSVVPAFPQVSAAGFAAAPDGKHVYFNVNTGAARVYVFDRRMNMFIASISLSGSGPVAITPDGKRVYVASGLGKGAVFVVDTANYAVVAQITLDAQPTKIAFNRDGTFAYILHRNPANAGSVSIIDTASNKLKAKVPVGPSPSGIGLTPDGKYAYITESIAAGAVAVMDTANYKILRTIAVGANPEGIAIASDGNHAYVTNNNGPTKAGSVSVLDTKTNLVSATVQVGKCPLSVVVTPDSRRAYVANNCADSVSVIDAVANKVTSTVPVASAPAEVGLGQAPPGAPFRDFKISGLSIVRGTAPGKDSFDYSSSITLSDGSDGIRPDVEAVLIGLDDFTTTIPAGSFKKLADGSFSFLKSLNGVLYNASITPKGGSLYLIHVSESGLTIPQIANPVQVRTIVGNDSGATAVNAALTQPTRVPAGAFVSR